MEPSTASRGAGAGLLRVPLGDVQRELERVLLMLGFAPDRAATCARLFAETSLDGIASHGLNRFPRFVEDVRNGIVLVDAQPRPLACFGAWEQWDGGLGPGNLNALACTERAMTLAREHGIGCVALRNTNHWMRGGSYGWHAAPAGHGLLAWTNTKPNLPPWGAREVRLGNNPLVVAVPNGDAPIVLDMAMSQYSYGRLEVAALRGESLGVPGGFDERGQPTTDPATILASQRPLPIGYWKGAALALTLDLLAATLSGGQATAQIGRQPEESWLSQVFVAFDVTARAGAHAASVAAAVLEDLARTPPVDSGSPVRYPGEQVLRTRRENLRLGVPVDARIWTAIRAL